MRSTQRRRYFRRRRFRDGANLEEIERRLGLVFEGSGKSDVDDAGVEKRRDERGRARGCGLGKTAREEVDEWEHADEPRHGVETLVENGSDTRAEHSRVLRGYHGRGGGSRNVVDDDGFGSEDAL